jgi:predicted AlkP superfamily phosphohydrolase/phosphomutase
MDDLIGRVTAKLTKDDVLFVLSDHGFKSFRRCVNLNTWLWKNGYMKLKEDRIQGRDYFGDVDWSRTKAFAIGMGAIFLNLKGREAQGIVDPSEANALKQEISSKLLSLTDPLDFRNSMNSSGSSNPIDSTKPKQLDSTLSPQRFALCAADSSNPRNLQNLPTSPTRVIRRVWDAEEIYSGPYKDQAPDLTVGWEDGYRASWEGVTGKLKEPIIEDNTKAWSGDHCVDTDIVPGVFFSNRKIETGIPRMVDIAPSILDIFDIKKPAYIDGTPFSFR